MKKEVFFNLDKHVSNPDVILASSTSCICPSLFTENLLHKTRSLVAHPVSDNHILIQAQVKMDKVVFVFTVISMAC